MVNDQLKDLKMIKPFVSLLYSFKFTCSIAPVNRISGVSSKQNIK